MSLKLCRKFPRRLRRGRRCRSRWRECRRRHQSRRLTRLDPFGDRDPTARPVVGVEQACFPAGFTMALGESLDHRGARTLLVVKPESPRELSSALTGRLEINTATTIRHSQPAELDLVEQGDEPRARFTNSSMRGSRILMKLRV